MGHYANRLAVPDDKTLRKASPASFYWANIHARNTLKGSLGLCLDPLTEEECKPLRSYLNKTNEAGYSITESGELKNLFSMFKGWGPFLIDHAVANGASRLNCFDGYLPTFYARHGFLETNRIPWDGQYAPRGWKTEVWGTPDVVFMEQRGEEV